MLRVVELIRQGRAAGKYMAKIETYGKILNVGSFDNEELAHSFLNSHDDVHFVKLLEKGGRAVRFNEVSWLRQAKDQSITLACKYIYMKQNINSEQAKAIQWYCQDRGLVPQLSTFPTINFIRKSDGAKIQMTLMALVSLYKVQVEEDRKIKAQEKRRLENEAKWKPASGKYSS